MHPLFRACCFFLLIQLPVCTLFSQTRVPVFVSGTEGHQSYRIPAIVQLPGGRLLAFCEGRLHNSGDFGDINIVMKYSDDQGLHWSALQTVVDYDTLQAGNPAPVVDLRDPRYPNGRIFLFYNTGDNHEQELRKGRGLREVWWTSSTDGGVSWSQPVNITRQVHRPRQPLKNPDYDFPEDWRSYANTPGHALQFRNGKYKGRIYVAANHSAGDPQSLFRDYRSHGFYTDDHGESFRLSASLDMPGSNEATAAQWGRNGLLLNARNQSGQPRARIQARSRDGGQSWISVYSDPQLPDPVCQGSLLNLDHSKKNRRLAFCNPADTLQRNHLLLRISFNGGRSWRKNIPVDGSTDRQKDITAYSDLVQTGRRQIGVLYEKDQYSQILFSRIRY